MDVSDGDLSTSVVNLKHHKEDNSHRPLSHYDNNHLTEKKNLLSSNNNASIQQIHQIHPVDSTQNLALNTTVPQNIAEQNIVGKHMPTRNSLKHSRMVVLNKTCQTVPTTTVSSNLKYKSLGKLLLIGISVLSGLQIAISLWLLLWSPNLRARDNPYWSAIPGIISGFLGITYLTCCFKECSRNSKLIYWLKFLKYISITVSVIAVLASFIIFFFSLMHLITLESAVCSPPGKLETTCLCRSNSTEESLQTDSYHYVDLSCSEVNNILWTLVLVTCVTNAVILLFEMVYLYLHWISKDIHEYSRVPTKITELKLYKSNR
nr:uncharacterized protein LOC111504551 [Leptinotarsa decemlineata]